MKLEADEDKASKEAISEDNMSVEWEHGLEGKWRAIFTLQEGHKVRKGDELDLSLDRGGEFLNGGKAWCARGACKDVSDSGVCTLSFKTSGVPTRVTTANYSLRFVWKSTR